MNCPMNACRFRHDNGDCIKGMHPTIEEVEMMGVGGTFTMQCHAMKLRELTWNKTVSVDVPRKHLCAVNSLLQRLDQGVVDVGPGWYPFAGCRPSVGELVVFVGGFFVPYSAAEHGGLRPYYVREVGESTSYAGWRVRLNES